ncbi:DUF2203 domain-containing protein [Pseudalkalibacillus caeni]|uniref:DUF2203 family protein n=1 Tax=Exobacillus caeni TaxID=2574798 RepID=A0A5R9F5E0_9BACL|nr:DUF2203 domain-containing protein [Pseudalkalibacillus caeni]TLS37556.1 DUF2203 family protein [Pseudalkalibacillus caeni]
MARKYFTLEEANEILPEVSKELARIKQIKEEFNELYQQLQMHHKTLQYRHKTRADADIMFKKETQMEFMEIEVKTYIRNIVSKGVEIKAIDQGLLDFPAQKDGEEIMLCWKEGEEEINYYHGTDEGFAGRKPITE